MFARRTGRMNRRGLGVPSARSSIAIPNEADGLLSIITSKTCVCLLVGDAGAGANQWDDQSGNGFHFTEATNPPVAAEEAAINNRVAYTANGTDQLLTNADLDFSNPQWIVTVFNPDGWTAGDRIWGSVTGATAASLVQNPTTSPNMRCQSGSNGPTNAGAVAGAWTRARTLYTQSTADHLRLAATQVTGINTSSGFGTGRQLFAHNSASFSAAKIALWGVWNGEPTTAEKTAVDQWITLWYGSGVAVG